MNVSEPDWAYVTRSLVKVVAVASALFLALVVADRVLWVFVGFDDERTALVYGTAARVVNPDKRLTYGYSDGGGQLGTTYTLRGEPRRAGPGEDRKEYEITEDLFGAVRAPSFDGPSGSLADTVDSVGWEELGADRQLTEEARKAIDALPQTLRAVAVLEFTHSMTTEQLVAFNRRHELCGGGDVSYIYSPYYYDDSSGDPPLSAVVWNRGMPKEPWEDFTYECVTEPEAALAEFRRWVGLLRSGDDLEEFGLSHGSLTETAKEGVVYGLVIDGWTLADLRKLLDDPEVRTVNLTDVAFDLG
ncbi:hypothetical protein [Streptosporangium sp. NPDC049078]|uniref:hypothetical protein n=1 Tax=Streptosporangium sp. NPDC049078 TaxID=3155767 RepID=UPI00342FAF57